MTSSQQDKAFLEEVIPTNLLDSAIDWISNNLEPGDVFSKDQLREWARANDFQEVD